MIGLEKILAICIFIFFLAVIVYEYYYITLTLSAPYYSPVTDEEKLLKAEVKGGLHYMITTLVLFVGVFLLFEKLKSK